MFLRQVESRRTLSDLIAAVRAQPAVRYSWQAAQLLSLTLIREPETKMRISVVVAMCAASLFATSASAQTLDAPAMDSLLQRLVGSWTMVGTVRGRPATYRLDAIRTLQNRFVELHMEDVARPPRYEARVFLGVDSVAGRYIVHWLDSFGAAYSIPHAVGEARPDTILFAFPYTHGRFRDTFSYDRVQDAWHFLLESADSAGNWRLFAEYQVRRR